MKPLQRVGTSLVIAVVSLTGCGGDGATTSDQERPSAGSDSGGSSADISASGSPDASASGSPTVSASAAASSGSSGGPTPGSAVDLPYEASSVMAVIGVRHDSVLNLRSGPGTSFAVVRTLDPLSGGLVLTGRGWQVPGGSYWAEMTGSGTTGWASLRYLAVRDGTEDLTARVVELLGRRPVEAGMAQLGQVVARALSSTDPPSTVVMSKAPSQGDLGEVTYDVVGLGDDSVRALRLVVFGQPDGAGRFSLKSVEATSFCARGAPGGGELCP